MDHEQFLCLPRRLASARACLARELRQGGAKNLHTRRIHAAVSGGHAQANRPKPSGIAAKETIFRVHLLPRLRQKPLDAVTTEDVQQLKAGLAGRSAKTVNKVSTVLSVALKTALEWNVIERVPCHPAAGDAERHSQLP
jgi:hypothetical protein